jgi:hypothetical protein
MKAKNIFIAITIIAAVLSSGTLEAMAGGKTKKPPGKSKTPPCKPAPKGKPNKPKTVVIKPTTYSGQAIAVNLTNVMTGQHWYIADTGPLPSTGGSLELTVGATTIQELSLGGAKVTTSGIGGVATSKAEVQNLSATFIHEGVTYVVAFASATAEARAECSASGVQLTGGSQIVGLTIDGTNVVVSGQPNQVVMTIAGPIILNAQVSSISADHQYGEIEVAAAFVMFTNCFNGPIGYAKADIKCGSTLPPEVSACGKVTGGGFITATPSGAHGSFGVSGGIRRGQFWGHLNYIDHGSGMHVSSSAVTGFSVMDAVTRRIEYSVTIDGAIGTATVIVADNGEPGRNDLFDITLSIGYHAGADLGGSRPGGGNIQLHKCPPGWAK